MHWYALIDLAMLSFELSNTTAYINYQNNVGGSNQVSYMHILTVF
jgi:hypothetical protein